VLGIRPEHVVLRPDGPLAGRVVMTEYLGSGHNVHVDTGAGRLVLAAEAEPGVKEGDTVRLAFRPDKVRLYPRENGGAGA
jgi:ABC-type sugar transport system ATPase subunit